MRIIYGLALVLSLVAPAHAGRYLDLINAAAVATRPGPAPNPTPPPSGECENCNGTGKLGDGTVFVPCPVCGGDGRLDTTALPPAPTADSLLAEGPAKSAGGFSEQTLPPEQQPTPMAEIGNAMRLLNPRGKVFLDIGAGYDCRAGIVAVRDFGAARVIAIERDPEVAESARRYVAHNGLADRIQIITADAAAVEFPAGAVGYAYLFEDALRQLAPKIRQLDRFASFAHQVPGLTMQRSGDLFVYQKPTATAVIQQFRQPVAVWRGRTYSRPVCGNSRCAMCQNLRRQLGMR